MLCTGRFLNCRNSDADTTIYGEKSAPKEVRRTTGHKEDLSNVGCLGKQDLRRKEDRRVRRLPAADRRSLRLSGRVSSGLVAMSPWKKEIQRSGSTIIYDQDLSMISGMSSQADTDITFSNQSNFSNASRYGRFGLRGQLKIDLRIINADTIDLHISAAKNLKSNGSERICFYVEARIEGQDGDDTTLPVFVTHPIRGTTNPTFEETLKFSDLRRVIGRKHRLLLSVRQMRPRESKTDLVGCMSFGVRHLLAKEKHVNGWFYLLNDELGRRKHLRVVQSTSNVNPLAGISPSQIVPEMHDQYSDSSSGRTSSPLHADDLAVMSEDEEATLHEYDFAAVEYMDMNTVHRLLKSTPKYSPGFEAHGYTNLSVSAIENAFTDLKMLDDDIPPPDSTFGRSDMDPTYVTMRETPQHQKKTAIHSLSSFASMQTPGGPNNTTIESMSEQLDSSYYDVTTSDLVTSALSSCDQSMYYQKMYRHTSSKQMQQKPSRVSTAVNQKSLQVLREFHAFESEFVSSMQEASQRISRPLRHCVLPLNEYKTLFQNMEKLIVISQFHVRRLEQEISGLLAAKGDTSVLGDLDSGIGAAYLPQLSLVCESYAAYCHGLPAAMSLLDKLMDNADFANFQRTIPASEDQLDIVDFLRKPVMQIEQLIQHFDRLLQKTPMSSPGFEDVKTILESLLTSLKGAPINAFARSVDSGIGNSPRVSHSSPGSSVPGLHDQFRAKSLASLCNSMYSVDAEVADLEDRLIIPSSVPEFQLTTPNRHLIYADDVLIADGDQWSKVRMTLFSDALLLTQDEFNDQIVALREPISLRDIVGVNFECCHPSEFTLTVGNIASRKVTLLCRSSRADQKSTWSHLIQQKMNTCRIPTTKF